MITLEKGKYNKQGHKDPKSTIMYKTITIDNKVPNNTLLLVEDEEFVTIYRADELNDKSIYGANHIIENLLKNIEKDNCTSFCNHTFQFKNKFYQFIELKNKSL